MGAQHSPDVHWNIMGAVCGYHKKQCQGSSICSRAAGRGVTLGQHPDDFSRLLLMQQPLVERGNSIGELCLAGQGAALGGLGQQGCRDASLLPSPRGMLGYQCLCLGTNAWTQIFPLLLHFSHLPFAFLTASSWP